jgi:prepilin-type N-terminal cleavage/methylation domain-containing protein
MLAEIRRRVHLSQRDDGFTLVELIVAMVIIAGVLMTLIVVQISAATTIVEARKRTQATAFANEAMEQMRAIPWAYLSRGLYNGFVSASGGDSAVSGSTLTAGGETFTLIVAAPGAYTSAQLADPWQPLFDTNRSNKQVRKDVAKTNTSFTVRAYVTQPKQGLAGIAVGLVVTVSWLTNKGATAQTVLQSTAFKGAGCGDESSTPFLSACQAFLDANASSGVLTTSVTATTVSDGINPVADVNLLFPTNDPFYDLNMRSASAGAQVRTQQISTMTGIAQFGGVAKDDNDTATEPQEQGWQSGFARSRVIATDDTSQTNVPLHVGTTTLTQASSAENLFSLSHGGSDITFQARSDYQRPTTATASSTTSCRTGIPSAAPCANVAMGNNATIDGGSGYILMNVGNQIFRLSRRLANDPNQANDDQAWAARYATSAGTSAVGCTTVSGAGCVAAGATRRMARLSIGTVVLNTSGTTSTWNGAAAGEGLIIVEGTTGCTTGFAESILVQRGTNQKATAATATRCGQIRYWTGSAYSTAAFSASGSGPFNTATVTWTGSGYTVTASGKVEIQAATTTLNGTDPNCVEDGCAIMADTGTIVITVLYTITKGSDSYVVVSTTTIEGPTALATFKAAPSA